MSLLPRMHVLMEGEGTGGSGGGGYVPLAGEAFTSALPPEFRGHTALAPIKDIGGLVKSFISAQQMVGADKIVMPKADAGDDAWRDTFGKLGLPKTVDEYGIPFKKDGLPETFEFTEAEHKGMLETFHKAGLTKRQAEAAYKNMLGAAVEEHKKGLDAASQKKTAVMQELNKKYGNETPVKIAMAKQVVQRLGGQEFANYLNETGLGDDPRMIQVMVTLGELIGNDKMVADKFANSGFITNKDEAVSEIAKLQLDPTFMKQYMDGQDPGHKAALERMERLHKIAYPGQVTS